MSTRYLSTRQLYKNMKPFYKSKSFWLQVVLWVTMLMMPLMSTPPDESLTITLYLRRLVMPLTLMAVFYANYLWLAPKYLRHQGNGLKLIVINLLMILVLTLGLFEWMRFERQLQRKELAKRGIVFPERRGGPPSRIFYLGLIRDFYFLGTAAVLGCAVVVGRRWMSSEKKRQEAEVARREAELKNLRNQMNPHFLLNTLNNIYALTAFDTEKAQAAIMELSKILRHMLYDNQQPYVKLTDEVDFINNYVKLMRIRLASNVDVNTSIQLPNPCTLEIAPMIFISLVENAFKHGISPTQKSHININISANNDKIECVVENSNFPKDGSDRSGHGIGLVQVGQRLELSYPGKYEWQKGTNEDKTLYTSKITIYDTQLHHH